MCASTGADTIVLDTWASVWEFHKVRLQLSAGDWRGVLVIDGVTIFDDTISVTSYRWTPVDGATITFSRYDIGGGYSAVKMEVVTGGGTMLDVTNNSTKIIDSEEVTPPVSVTYHGSTIATLNAGDTKTLSCNGKVMVSNVVIGTKTLQCNGKLMASDVVVEVGGGR